jgi:glutaredoxin 3
MMPLVLEMASINSSIFSLFLQVLIWSKTYCNYCGRTKKLFSNPEFKDVTVKIHELDKMESGSAIQNTLASMTGQRTVPSVWVNGKFIGGNDDVQNAYKRGKLLPMLCLSSSKP